MSDRRVRIARAVALAVLIGLAICAVFWWRKPAPLPAPPPIASPGPSATPARESQPRAAPERGLATASPPIIDSIAVEKDEVCEGEENLVTVQAHTSDGKDAFFLHFQVGSTRGSPAVLRSYLDDRGRPTEHRVTVFGRNNVAVSAPVPSFRVKRCDGAAVVVIEHRLRPNTMAEFDFEARILNAAAMRADGAAVASVRARGFRWSFGDGAREEGHEPHVVHSFALRPQETLYSHFLVTVEVLAEDGRVLQGRHSIELLNPAFEAFAYKGIVLLFADLNPRFPAISPNGVVDQGVRLWHTRPGIVTVNKITVTSRRLDGQRSAAAFPSAGSVLGAAVIPPGRGLELRASLDTRAEPDTFARDYVLEGRTDDGHPVRGAFSVMRPPALPNKNKHESISDPILVAKVKIAREVLHREYVTDEDIWALERAGQFDGLRGDAAVSNAPLPSSLTLPAN